MNTFKFYLLFFLSTLAFAGEEQVKQIDDFLKVFEQVAQPGAKYAPPCRFVTKDSVLAPSKYISCIEPISPEMKSYYSTSCQTQGIKGGPSCLAYENQQFEDTLKAQSPTDYSRFIEYKKLNDDGDSQVCLRYVNGSWKRPSQDFLNRTKQLAPFIKATADYYGIPPVAIACAIGGDATVTFNNYGNQNLYDNIMIQATPVKWSKSDLKYFKFDYSKPPKPDISVGKVTKGEMQSIRDAALILRHADVLYTNAGFVAEDLPPEVLTSIYHLGAYRGNPLENMATVTMDEKRKPGLSFLGLFCTRYKNELQSILDSNAGTPQK